MRWRPLRPRARSCRAIYVSYAGRGGPHFGGPSAELQIVRRALGDVPLVGFFAGGEIAAVTVRLHRRAHGLPLTRLAAKKAELDASPAPACSPRAPSAAASGPPGAAARSPAPPLQAIHEGRLRWRGSRRRAPAAAFRHGRRSRRRSRPGVVAEVVHHRPVRAPAEGLGQLQAVPVRGFSSMMPMRSSCAKYLMHSASVSRYSVVICSGVHCDSTQIAQSSSFLSATTAFSCLRELAQEGLRISHSPGQFREIELEHAQIASMRDRAMSPLASMRFAGLRHVQAQARSA